VRTEAGEMLPRGHLEDPERAQDHSSYERRPSMIEVPYEERDQTSEDGDLGHRDPAEGTRRTLAAGIEPRAPRPFGRGLRAGTYLAFAAVLTPLRRDRAGRSAGPAALTGSALGALTGHGERGLWQAGTATVPR
jgi:hypothetical protein